MGPHLCQLGVRAWREHGVGTKCERLPSMQSCCAVLVLYVLDLREVGLVKSIFKCAFTGRIGQAVGEGSGLLDFW